MTCEGKDLNNLAQEELDQAYRFHVWDLVHRGVPLDTTEEEEERVAMGIEHKISEIRRIYLKRFGVKAYIQIETPVIGKVKNMLDEMGNNE